MSALLREQADHPTAIEQLKEVVERTQDWVGLAQIYEEILPELGELNQEVKHLLELAQVYENRLQDQENTLQTYQRVYAAASDSEPALLALERIYEQTADWRSLLEILRARLELSLQAPISVDSDYGAEDSEVEESDTEDVIANEVQRILSDESERLLVRIAELHEYTLSEPHEAIASHQELLSYLPERLESTRALIRLFEQVSQWNELVLALEKLVGSAEAEDSERLSAYQSLASVLFNQLERYEEVIPVLSLILDQIPNDEQSIAYLEHLVQSEDYKIEAAELLTPYYEQNGQVEHQIYTLSILANTEEDDTDSINQKVVNLHQIAKLQLSLNSIQEAYHSYEQAFLVAPESEETLTALTQLVAANEAWDTLIQSYESVLDHINNEQILAQRCCELAELYRSRTERSDQAVYHFEQARKGYESLFTADYDLSAVTEAVDVDSTEAIDADSTKTSSPYYEPLKAIYNTLSELYVEVQNYPELIDLYKQRVELLGKLEGTDTQISYLIKAAELSTQALEDYDQAIELYQQVLKLNAQHVPALDALCQLHSMRGSWEEVVRLLQSKEAHYASEEISERIGLKLQIAQTQVAQLNDLDAAIISYNELLDLSPEHPDALTELAQVYSMSSQWEESLVCLDLLIEQQEGEARSQTRFHAARLVRNELASPVDAIERLAKILDETVQHEESFLMLEEMIDQQSEATLASKVLTKSLEKVGDFGRLVESLRRLLNVTEQRSEQASLWMRIGKIYQDIFMDEASAFEAFAYALRAAPLTENAYPSMLKIISQAEEAWPRLAEELEIALNEIETAEFEAIAGNASLVSLHRWAAEVYEQHLGHDSEAVRHWEAIKESVSQESDEYNEALVTLERLYERSAQWEELAQVLNDRITHLDSLLTPVSQSQDSHLNTATNVAEPAYDEDSPLDETLSGDELDEPSNTELAYDEDSPLDETLLGDELDPVNSNDLEVNEAEISDEHSSVDEKITAELDHEQQALKLSLLQKLAQVYAECLQKTADALDTYREVFALSPSNSEAISGLNALFVSGEAQEEIAEILEPIYIQAEDWTALYQQKQGLLHLRHPGEEKREACQELAYIALESLNDIQSALGWYGEGFKEQPDHEACRLELHNLALENDFAPALIMLYAEAREQLSDMNTICSLSVHIAQVQMQYIQDWEAAERELVYARSIDEDRLTVYEGLDRVYSTLERWPELESILSNEIRLLELDGEEHSASIESLYWRIADLYEYRLGQLDRAVETFQHLNQLKPEDLSPTLRLETLFQTLARHEELLDVYLIQESLLEDSDQLEVQRKIARLLTTELNRSFEAIDLWRKILTNVEGDQEALNALEKLYESTEEWRDLISICEQQLELHAGQTEVEVNYLSKLGYIWGDRLERPQSAISTWQKVVTLNPSSIEARWAMRGLYRQDNDRSTLLNINLELLHLIDAELKSLTQAGNQALSDMIDSSDQPSVDQIEMPNTDAAEAHEAQLHAQLADIEEAIADEILTTPEPNVYSDPMAHESTPEHGADEEYNSKDVNPDLDAASFAESAQSPLEISQYDSEQDSSFLGEEESTSIIANENDAVVEEAHQTLTYDAASQEPQISIVNQARLDILSEQRAEVLRELADLYLESEQVTEAIEILNLRLLAVPSCINSMFDLESLYESQSQWSEYCDILKHRSNYTEDINERNAILFTLAESQENYLQDSEGAVSSYHMILGTDPNHYESFEHLTRLLSSLERWVDLINVLNQRIEVSEDAEESLSLALRISEIYESQDNPQDALVVLGQAFTSQPNDQLLGEQIENLASQTNMWTQAIQLYEACIAQVGAGDFDSIPLRMRVARWYDEAINQPQHAVTHYQTIQQIDPEDIDSLSALEALYEKHSQWQFAAQLIEQKLPKLNDVEESTQAWKRLAQIRHEYLEDYDGALDAYQEVLSYEPEDLETLRALKDLYAMKQDFYRLIEILEREADLHENIEVKVENLLRIAEIKEVRLNDVDGAILAYHDAFESDPNCVDALLSLEQLYRQQKNAYELQKVYESLIIARTNSNDQLNTYNKLARLQLEELNDREGAIDSYRKMFIIDAQYTEAVTALDQLYRDDQRWEELKEIYEQYLERAPNADHTMVRLVLSELSEMVHHDETKAREQAIAYLLPILDSNPKHLDTLSRLSLLHGQLGHWTECVQYMNAELEFINDIQAKIEKMYHLGMVHLEHLDAPHEAIEWLKKALELNPNYSPAMIELKDIYETQGDYQAVIRVLTMMEAQANNEIEKSKCYFEMGRIYTQLLGDSNTGLEYYSRAIDIDPSNVEVAPFLIEVYLRDERWEKAKPLLELLINNKQETDVHKRREHHFNLALCAQNLRLDDLALTQYQEAYRLDSTHFQTLEGLSEVYLRREDWEGAANMLQAILIHHGERLTPEARVEVMYKQGKAKFMLADDRRTLDLLIRVMEIQPHHQKAMELLIQTYERREKWEEAIYYRQRRLELTEDQELRFDALIEIGKIYQEKLGQQRSAIEAYENALQLKEQSRLVFGALLPLYESVEDWGSTVQLLTHFANNESDGPTKAKYFYAIGALQRDQIRDNLQAVRSFDKALDANPTELKAFTAIEELLVNERNFERQDRYFRKMLKRATEHSMGDDMIFELAKALGEINRTRLSNYAEAIKAYNIALSKRPNDVNTRNMIAELYEHEQKWDLAIAQHREILRIDVRQMNSLHKLFRLFVGQTKYDEAWCVAQALVCLRHARDDEQDFYSKHHSRRLGDIRKHLENDHWAYLVHPKKSPLMDRLFESLYVYNAPAMMMNHKGYGVHKRRDLMSAGEQTAFNSVLDFVSKVTRFERLACYAGPSGVNGLRSMNTNPPAILVGQDMQHSMGMKALVFSISKLLFMMTPHALMATLDEDYDSRRNRLKIIIFTLMRMAGIEVQDYDSGLVDVYRKIDDGDLNKVNHLLNEMQTDQRAHLDVSRWLEGLDHTANRLGFVLCNDLVEATQAIRNESILISRASIADRIQELIIFSVSEEYFALRKGLGINIRT